MSPISSITLLANPNGPGNVLIDGATTFDKNVEIKAAAYVETAKIGRERIGIGPSAQLEPVLYVNSVPSSTGFDSFLKINSDEIEVTLLRGTGDAYVCVNANGELFISYTPCR